MDEHFIGLKLLSIFSIGCIGSGQMFLPIFYKKVLELGNDKIGLIYSITPFVSFIALPYWTALIDRTGQYKKIMMTNMLIALVCILSIGLVPFISDKEWPRIILSCIGCFGYAFFGYPVIVALVDTVILRVLAERKDLYGRQKIGVPIGFASSVFLTGLLTEKLDSLYALFIIFTIYNLLFVITVWFVSVEPYQFSYKPVEQVYGSMSPSPAVVIEDENDEICATPTAATAKLNMWTLLKDPGAVQFFTFMTLMGFCIAVVHAFLYLYFENDLHGTPSMVGLFGPIGSSTEITVFFFSKEIFNRLGGRNMLIIAQSIIIYRCLTYMVCIELSFGAWLATATQLLHGVGISMTLSAGALQADRIAPEGLKSSAQGLLSMASSGIGSGVGALIGGVIYERFGAQVMWASVSIVAFLSILIYTSTFLRNTVFTFIATMVQKYK
ncbi:major facilitator superfamily domain-containing protein [Helicostylum pulchrum]|nr:major facilitator superfamily domain-containing protein [Helicostylum pulchrum]